MNTLIHGNSAEIMMKMPDNYIDMILTSPPYDDLRTYGDKGVWNYDEFKKIAKQIYRLLKKGGVCVWVVGDATIKGSETGSSFRQALYFKELGLRLHDTMIYEKTSSPYPSGKHSVRYTQIYEYMFILSKGRPKTINLIMDKPNKYAGSTGWGKLTYRQKTGELQEKCKKKERKTINKMGVRYNIWKYSQAYGYSTKDKEAHNHPAIFPEKLAADHIQTWSNKGDLILDCFAGSGTTLKVAKQMERNYIGIELNEEYVNLANKILAKYNI